MNFEELKKDFDKSVENTGGEKVTLDLNRGKNNPIAIIRRNMKREILTQLIGITIFISYPLVVPMLPLNEAVWYIFMFITSIMTLSYVIKLTFFLRQTNDFTANTKDTLKEFVFQAKLTLEVYKSFVIAGSLLLPIPVFALLTADPYINHSVSFERWFMLDVSHLEMTFLVIGYLIIALFFYYITKGWAKLLYGKYLKDIEKTIAELETE